MALVVQSFSISKILEVNARGEKQSEFLSMKFESDVSLTAEQAAIEQLEAHEVVERAITYNALASGMMTQETARDKLLQIKERHSGILLALREKYGKPDPEDFLKVPVSGQ